MALSAIKVASFYMEIPMAFDSNPLSMISYFQANTNSIQNKKNLSTISWFGQNEKSSKFDDDDDCFFRFLIAFNELTLSRVENQKNPIFLEKFSDKR